MKKIIALALSMSMLLVGCSSGSSKESSSNKESSSTSTQSSSITTTQTNGNSVFRNYLLADVETINPHTWSSSTSETIFSLASLKLYHYLPNETGDGIVFTSELADGEPIKADTEGKIWDIKIKENAKWSNGDKITADDVIYSFKMCLDPLLINSRASQLSSDYITIVNAKEYSLQGKENKVKWDDVGIKKIDDYKVQIICSDPVTEVDVKSHFNYGWTCIVHKPTYEACMSSDRTTNVYGSTIDKFMSCGGYILSDWISGAQFTFKKNPDYIKSDLIKLDGIVYKIVGDRNTALELFLSDDLDVVSIGADSIEQYIDDPRVMKSPSSSISSLVVNMGNTNNNGILGDADFRRALYYAIDRESIAKMVNGIPANWAVGTKCVGDITTSTSFRNMPESNTYIPEKMGYDKVKAKEYYDKAMKKAGLDKLTLTLIYSETSANYKAASEYLHKILPEVLGDTFTLELSALPSSVATENVRGWRNGNANSFELAWRGWDTSTMAPWNGLKVYTSMYTNKNEPYSNPEYDKLWEQANLSLEAKLDTKLRLDLTRQMEDIVIKEAVTIPVYEAPGYTLLSERIVLPVKHHVPGYGFGYSMSSITQ